MLKPKTCLFTRCRTPSITTPRGQRVPEIGDDDDDDDDDADDGRGGDGFSDRIRLSLPPSIPKP